MRSHHVVLAAVGAYAAAAAPLVTLQNENAVLSFDTGSLSLESLRAPGGGGANLVGRSALWTAQFVVASVEGAQTLTAADAACASRAATGPTAAGELTLTWSKCAVGKTGRTVDVVTTVKLPAGAAVAEVWHSFRSADADVGLWQWTSGVDGAPLPVPAPHGGAEGGAQAPPPPPPACVYGTEQAGYIADCAADSCKGHATLAQAQAVCSADRQCHGVTDTTVSSGGSAGFQCRAGLAVYSSSARESSWLMSNGAACHPPVRGAAVLAPHGFGVEHTGGAIGSFRSLYPQGTYQFVAQYPQGGGAGGLYVGVHDPTAASKTMTYTFSKGGLLQASTAAIGVEVVPPHAGEPLPGGRLDAEYPLTLAPFEGDWWDAAQIYRAWALPHAAWAQKGPIISRADVPAWLLQVPTWVNSHWQQNDIFNVSGGAPQVVLSRVTAIKERFALPPGVEMGLHWYEWDTLGYEAGSNYTNCSSEVTCGFDTHYPEYFPARDGFKGAVAALQKAGVRVAPYINGRIFDKGTASWTKDSGEAHAAKAPAGTPTLNSSDVALYDESYGSKAEFAVMCPHTVYWQKTIADVVGALVNEYGTDGVYIDQVAAAGPRPCFDKTHGHPVGGGSHWVTGYSAMLAQVRAQAGNNAVVLTESNAEPFMGDLNVFLTLVGFSSDIAGASRGVPAFPALYGGYYLAMGAEFFTTDFAPGNADVFSAKVGRMFAFGAQLGWFSLGGRDNQSPPMGIYELLMDAAYDAEVAFLSLLSRTKLLLNPWLQHGRAMRELVVAVNGTTLRSSTASTTVASAQRRRLTGDRAADAAAEPVLGVTFGPVLTAAWLAADGSSLLLLALTVQRGVPAASLGFDLDLSQYGLDKAQQYRAVSMRADAPEQVVVPSIVGGKLKYTSGALAAHDVLALRVEKVATELE